MRHSIIASAAVAALSLVGPSAASNGRIEVVAPSGEGKAKRPARFVRANVGRNHPDYGLSVADHAANKLARTGRAY